MTHKKTFQIGGIHLDKHKISALSPIIDAGVPELVYIPVRQHIGAPAVLQKTKGDKVKIGTLLAAADGIVSADVHSSVAGEIVKIEEMPGSSGYQELTVVIKTAPDEFETGIDTGSDIVKEITASREEIISAIRKAGIVGMGGAGYPTPIKTELPENKKADCLIVNAIECEPYLTADGALMLEKAEQIIVGAKIINKALGIQNAVIAIDENKPQAIEKLTKISKSYIGVNVRVCKSKYPQGGERQLINAITGREVPSGRLPIDAGCIVQNVATVFAVYEAETQTSLRTNSYRKRKHRTYHTGKLPGQGRDAGGIYFGFGTNPQSRNRQIAFRRADDGNGGSQPANPDNQTDLGAACFVCRRSSQTGRKLLHPLRQMRRSLPRRTVAVQHSFRSAAQRHLTPPRTSRYGLHRMRLLCLYLSGQSSASGLLQTGQI